MIENIIVNVIVNVQVTIDVNEIENVSEVADVTVNVLLDQGRRVDQN